MSGASTQSLSPHAYCTFQLCGPYGPAAGVSEKVLLGPERRSVPAAQKHSSYVGN